MRSIKSFGPTFVLLFILVIVVAACSSLPKKIEPRSLDFARMKMKVAREAQQQRDYEQAALLYRDAYDYFTRIDDIEGKIKSAISLARQYFYLNLVSDLKRWLTKAAGLIANNRPDMAGAKAVLDVEMAFSQENFEQVLNIATSIRSPNLEWQLELDCMAMVAQARLNKNYDSSLQQVLTNLPVLEKRFRKGRIEDAGVLSQTYYYIGYIYSKEGKWQEAAEYFEQAKRVDGSIDNSYGLANDLYAMARCLQKIGLQRKAGDAYRRAAEIFELLGDKEMVEKINEKSLK